MTQLTFEFDEKTYEGFCRVSTPIVVTNIFRNLIMAFVDGEMEAWYIDGLFKELALKELARYYTELGFENVRLQEWTTYKSVTIINQL